MPEKRVAQFVDSMTDLQQLCDALRPAEWLALDTEFLREKTYYPKLCLIQVATPDVLACVDPLALDNLDPLLDLLYEPGRVKVFHAARQDLEIFYHLRGALPAPVFDTQLAAPLLGHADQIGYGALMERVVGVKLAKSHGRTDWSKRPLHADQLGYAADDVRYLAQAYPKMRKRLAELGRLDWLRADFDALVDPDRYETSAEHAWQRVRSVNRLNNRQRAVLQALCAWRETSARERDRPRKWILDDEALVNLSRVMPEDMDRMQRIRGLPDRLVQRNGATLLELIAASRDGELAFEGKDMRAQALSAEQNALVEALHAVVSLYAVQHELHPSVLATRKDLERVVRGDTEAALFQGWRDTLIGDEVRGFLRGERVLRVIDGGLTLTA